MPFTPDTDINEPESRMYFGGSGVAKVWGLGLRDYKRQCRCSTAWAGLESHGVQVRKSEMHSGSEGASFSHVSLSP